MNFIELTSERDGTRYLYDFDSSWEIHDRGEAPALWSNHDQGRNLDAQETYAAIRGRLAMTNIMLQSSQETSPAPKTCLCANMTINQPMGIPCPDCGRPF